MTGFDRKCLHLTQQSDEKVKFTIEVDFLGNGTFKTYDEIDVMRDAEKKQEMMNRAGRHTVPQIFIDDQHVGGCDELYALERSGKLDPMLAA